MDLSDRSGPNGAGKSVYIKQVGLIVFLAHIGSFVPAKSATIGNKSRNVDSPSSLGLCDRLFARIHNRSRTESMPTFTEETTQVADMFRLCTKQRWIDPPSTLRLFLSLVLLDEFGKVSPSSSSQHLMPNRIQIHHVVWDCSLQSSVTLLIILERGVVPDRSWRQFNDKALFQLICQQNSFPWNL